MTVDCAHSGPAPSEMVAPGRDAGSVERQERVLSVIRFPARPGHSLDSGIGGLPTDTASSPRGDEEPECDSDSPLMRGRKPSTETSDDVHGRPINQAIVITAGPSMGNKDTMRPELKVPDAPSPSIGQGPTLARSASAVAYSPPPPTLANIRKDHTKSRGDTPTDQGVTDPENVSTDSSVLVSSDTKESPLIDTPIRGVRPGDSRADPPDATRTVMGLAVGDELSSVSSGKRPAAPQHHTTTSTAAKPARQIPEEESAMNEIDSAAERQPNSNIKDADEHDSTECAHGTTTSSTPGSQPQWSDVRTPASSTTANVVPPGNGGKVNSVTLDSPNMSMEEQEQRGVYLRRSATQSPALPTRGDEFTEHLPAIILPQCKAGPGVAVKMNNTVLDAQRGTASGSALPPPESPGTREELLDELARRASLIEERRWSDSPYTQLKHLTGDNLRNSAAAGDAILFLRREHFPAGEGWLVEGDGPAKRGLDWRGVGRQLVAVERVAGLGAEGVARAQAGRQQAKRLAKRHELLPQRRRAPVGHDQLEAVLAGVAGA